MLVMFESVDCLTRIETPKGLIIASQSGLRSNEGEIANILELNFSIYFNFSSLLFC